MTQHLSYNINFEAAAFFFIASFYIYLRKKYCNTSVINKTFRRLTFCQLTAIFFDVAASITISYPETFPAWLDVALNTLYFAATAYLFYTLYLFFLSFGIRKKVGMPLLLTSRAILIMFLIMLFVNAPTGVFFSVRQGAYAPGSLYYLCLAIPVVFLLACSVAFMIIRKRVTRQVFGVLLTLLVLTVLGPALQFLFFPTTLLSHFFSLFSLILCLFALVSPDYAELTKKRAELFELQQNLETKAAQESDKVHKRGKQKEILFEQIIDALAETIDAGDAKRNGHSENVAETSRLIAYKMALPKNEVQKIYYAAILHDIGIIGVPESVTTKSGKFTQEDFEQMKKHCEIGERILSTISEMPEISKIARSHHERFDGSGYPDGLAGKQIPLAARIIAVADAYDAMTHERCYKNILSTEEAKEELKKGAGLQFDPLVVAAALEVL